MWWYQEDLECVISSWMAWNFLSLNPAKTEFLLIGLPAQLSKIHNPTLTISSNTTIIQPVSSARNLGIIFDSNLSFSDHISCTFRNPASLIFVICDVFVILWITKLPALLQLLSFTVNLDYCKLDYCNSLYLNISNQQLNRLQHSQLCCSCCHKNSKIPSHILLPISNHLIHGLKITQRIQYKMLSLTYKSLQYNK